MWSDPGGPLCVHQRESCCSEQKYSRSSWVSRSALSGGQDLKRSQTLQCSSASISRWHHMIRDTMVIGNVSVVMYRISSSWQKWNESSHITRLSHFNATWRLIQVLSGCSSNNSNVRQTSNELQNWSNESEIPFLCLLIKVTVDATCDIASRPVVKTCSASRPESESCEFSWLQ